MRTSRKPERLVVDANPILSALLGGAAGRLFFSQAIVEFAVTEEVLREVERYLPSLAQRLEIRVDVLHFAIRLLPLRVHPKRGYQNQVKEAWRRIGERDPHDVDTVALALALGLGMWTNDRDFEQTGLEAYTTGDLMELFAL